MGFIEGVLGAIVFIIVLALVLGFIALMMPLVFSLGTIFDRKVSN